MELQTLIQSLRDAGLVIQERPQPERRAYSLGECALALGVSVDWMRDHLHEFPNAYRLPGGGNGGALRIPVRDLDAFEKRRRILRNN